MNHKPMLMYGFVIRQVGDQFSSGLVGNLCLGHICVNGICWRKDFCDNIASYKEFRYNLMFSSIQTTLIEVQ